MLDSAIDANTLGALLALNTQAHGLLFLIALSGIRVTTIFLVLPAMSSQAVPGAVRAGACYLMTWFIAAGQSPAAFDNLTIPDMLLLTMKEAFIGLMIGYLASIIFWIAESAGTLIDDLAGFNNVQMTNPMHGDQSTPVASLLVQLTITLFHISGGMTVLLGVLFESYHWWPLISAVPDLGNAAASLAIDQGNGMLSTAVKICAPIMLALVLIDVGLSIIGRAAGKLEPNSLSQPLRGLIGVVLLVAMIGAISVQVRDAIHFTGFSGLLEKLRH